MRFGASMFFTDYSITPTALARALEVRGFDIMWAPEHSHIPLSRKTPFVLGADLPKRYYDVMDPFVTLAAAAARIGPRNRPSCHARAPVDLIRPQADHI